MSDESIPVSEDPPRKTSSEEDAPNRTAEPGRTTAVRGRTRAPARPNNGAGPTKEPLGALLGLGARTEVRFGFFWDPSSLHILTETL